MPSQDSELSIGARLGSILFTPAGPDTSGVNTDHSCQPKLMELHTPDLGGKATTKQVNDAVCETLRSAND